MKRTLLFLLAAILGFGSLTLLNSCGGGESTEDDANAKPKKEKPQLPLAVAVYMDNSASMKGYYAPNSGSAVQITDLLAAIQAKYRETPIRAYYTQKGAKGTEVKRYSFDDLSTNIATKNMGYTDAYQLDQFIKLMEDETKADSAHRTMNFFITDGILSGTSGEISKNSEFNTTYASLLRNRIDQAITPLVKMGYGVGIFQFNVNFSGTYYNYKNVSSNYNGQRPLYVIAIGPADEVNSFAKLAEQNSLKNFEPENQLVLSPINDKFKIFVDECVVNGTTFTFSPSEDNLVDDGRYAKTNVRIPLSNLPAKLNDIDALQSSIVVTLGNKEIDPSTIKIVGEKAVIPVKISSGTSPKFTIQINDAMPGWVSASNSDNDVNIKVQAGQTFNLQNLVDGLSQGVLGSSTNMILAPVTYIIDWSNPNQE